tara:strand:- start:119 stop:1342 length:1224 start_codon:yes stop_codon:yes gene_type:complete
MLGLATALNSGSLKKKSVLTNKFSAELDGTGDYIDVSSLSSDLDKSAGTISMWIKVLDTSANESFFNCSDGDDTDNKIFLIYSTSGTKFQAGYKFAGTSIIAAYTITHDDLTGLGWFHLAMTYNTSTPLIQLFLNGTRVAQRTTSLTTIAEDVGIDTIRLGSNSTANDTYHYGNIDEFIYIAGKDLTETEMLLLYNNGKPDDIGDLPSAIYKAIKCWLRFGEGSIDGTADQTSVVFDNKNATLGSELIVNGDFSTSETITTSSHTLGWSRGGTGDTGSSIVSNQLVLHRPVGEDHDHARIYASDGSSSRNVKPSDHQGKIFRLRLDIAGNTGSGNLQVFTGGAYVNLPDSTVGTKEFYYVSDNTQLFVMKMNTEGATMTIDNVSLKQIQGNPGFCVADATVGNVNVP